MEQSFRVGVGTKLQPGLGFWANGAYVDNPGGQWVQLPDFGRTIAPYTVGAVIAFPWATTAPRLTTNPIAGQVNTGAGDAATITFTDAGPANAPGTPVDQLSPTAGSTITSSGTGTGPATAVNTYSFAFSPTGLTVGNTYRISDVEISVIPNGSATVARSGRWQLTYTGLSDPIAMGSFNIAGAGPVSTDIQRILSPVYEFTHVGGGQFTIQFINVFGAFGPNDVFASVLVKIIPVTY